MNAIAADRPVLVIVEASMIFPVRVIDLPLIFCDTTRHIRGGKRVAVLHIHLKLR